MFAPPYAKFKACSVVVLSLDGVAEEVQKHLWPIVRFRSNNRPFRKDVAQRMDHLQTQCIAIAAGIAPELDEPLDEFHRRRSKSAGVAATLRGRWSLMWAKQVCSWHDHNLRNSIGLLWASDVMQVRPASWLREMRAKYVPSQSSSSNPFTADAGRLGTRSRRGGPHRRWEDAVADARMYVEQDRLTGLLKLRERKAAQKFVVKVTTTLGPADMERLDDVDSD